MHGGTLCAAPLSSCRHYTTERVWVVTNPCYSIHIYIQLETYYKTVKRCVYADTESFKIICAFCLLACLLVRSLRSFEMCTQTKAAALMSNIPQADIDASGVFKYVLIRVHSREEEDDSEVDIVRGYGWAEFHADIYEKVSEELEKSGHLDCECIGGGRIRHDSQAKKIHVYGYSMGFGRANHAITTEKLKARYPDYEVTWDNEGY